MCANFQKPFIIPVFIPHAGCPHQCVFCNQVSITGSRGGSIHPENVRRRIQQFLAYNQGHRHPVEIAFYGGNFLGLKMATIRSLLETAAEFVNHGRVDGIRFSTRPDTIDDERLKLLENYPVAAVELGAQSMDDNVLDRARRGHSAADTVRAVEKLKKIHCSIGLQMMIGLPGENEAGALASAREIAGLLPDFVRIYPTVVIADSPLAQWYRQGEYVPLSLEKAVGRVAKIYRIFSSRNIRVIRMGLQASQDLDDGATVVAGPYHPAFGHLVYSALFLEKACRAIARRGDHPLTDRVSITVHPRDISRMKGLKNANIEKIKKKFDLEAVAVGTSADMSRGGLEIKESPGCDGHHKPAGDDGGCFSPATGLNRYL
jgi:histone acetyltransferase (RNA polymerase elongator complex component)